MRLAGFLLEESGLEDSASLKMTHEKIPDTIPFFFNFCRIPLRRPASSPNKSRTHGKLSYRPRRAAELYRL